MTISLELLGIGITVIGLTMSPVYYFMYKISNDVSKVTTTIELCPNCPHGAKERDYE